MQATTRGNSLFCGRRCLPIGRYIAPLLWCLLAGTSTSASAQIAFQAQPALTTGATPFSLATGDFDGDGNLDLAVAVNSNHYVYIYTGSGDGVFHYTSFKHTTFAPVAIVAADLRHANRAVVDLVVGVDTTGTAAIAGGFSTLLGNGNATFQNELLSATGAVAGAAYSVAVDDFDQDGLTDVAVTNAQDNSVSVLLGNGDGSFGTAANYAGGTGPSAVAAGDFDGDGVADIAVADFVDNTVSILLNNGNGNFGTRVSYPTGSGPNSITVGDFNRDGNLDLAITNYNDNSTWVMFGDGHGAFGSPTIISTGAPAFVVAADFDGDGILDLAIANYLSGPVAGSVTVYRGVGDGSFQRVSSFPAGDSPSAIVVGNFNHDAKPDLAVTNRSTNTVTVLLNVSTPTDRVFTGGFE